MRERPNRHAWKVCVGQPTVGSNPTLSAQGSVLFQTECGPGSGPGQSNLGSAGRAGPTFSSGPLEFWSEQTLTPRTWAQADPSGFGSGAVGGGAGFGFGSSGLAGAGWGAGFRSGDAGGAAVVRPSTIGPRDRSSMAGWRFG